MAPVKLLPRWKWQLVKCDTSVTEVAKRAPELHFCMHLRELQAKYLCPEFSTDASKLHVGISYAAVSLSFSEFDILYMETSIFTAEAYAVFMAAKHIKQLKLQKATMRIHRFVKRH